MQQVQLIGINPDDLIDLIDNKVKKQLDDFKSNFQPKEPTQYVTRQEVAEMLSIDISTVHNYTKKGILQAYQIGRRVYYKRKELEKALIKLNK